MCAIGHVLEQEGLATVSITLVRPHVEAVKPPRSLWVPFELGRPLGAPDNSAFQRRVLKAALDLLESTNGPVVLEDFPDDAPNGSTSLNAESQEGWTCPVALRPAADASNGYESAIVEEVAMLRPWHDVAKKNNARTTVGVTGTDIEDIARFIASQISETPLPSYRTDLGLGDAVKLATDDLKAFYLEAAAAQPGESPSTALTEWFWSETTAGKVFLELRSVCANSDDPIMKALGAFILVPRSQLHRLPR